MTSNPHARIETLDWRGMLIRITYYPAWSRIIPVAHLEIETQEPARAPMPISETGYKSHFVDGMVIAQTGGPSEYVLAWLEREAKSKHWAFIEEESRQPALF